MEAHESGNGVEEPLPLALGGVLLAALEAPVMRRFRLGRIIPVILVWDIYGGKRRIVKLDTA